MTDETRPRPLGPPQEKKTPRDEGAPDTGARGPRRRPGAAGRIAVAGVGIAALLGLVTNMEVTEGRAKSADPASSPALVSLRTAKGAHAGPAPGLVKVAAVKASRPIVLTPHAVVHTVGAPSSGGGGSSSGGGGYYSAPAAAAAPAPAAAPVVSSGGS